MSGFRKSMTPYELKARFPNASDAFISANCDRVDDPRSAPELERSVRTGALVARQVKEANSQRFLVSVESVRRRLLDEDNLCEKYHVDCCRYAGLLPGDSPAQVSIETTQRKATKGEEEHTVITITPL